MAGEALDLEDVSLFLLNGVGVSTYCRGVVVMILSPFSSPLGILLMVLVLLRVGRKSLLSGK